MWIATKHGFYSIVEKTPGEFHVRARKKKDLENLLALVPHSQFLEIERWPSADYRWRIQGSRHFVDAVMKVLAATLDYSNFKSEIARTLDQREKLPAYHDLWHELYSLQK